MYFDPEVPVHTTPQRGVLYTNCSFLRTATVPLVIGELAPSSSYRPVSTVTLTVTEHLENGPDDILVATSGEELLADFADVLSFGLDATFSFDRDLLQRLVPRSLEARGRGTAASMFRRTFDPHLMVLEPQLEELRELLGALLGLRRPNFEAGLKAIKRVVAATRRAADDPTLAYTDMIAALESLSDKENAPEARWDQLDKDRRALIDKALENSAPELADDVRKAVLEAERTGATARFVHFVQRHVSPTFFREEATDASNPIRGADFERALKLAYSIRSRNVHGLVDLPDEARFLPDQADTLWLPEYGTILTLEGLHRLARHVIRAYIGAAPTGVDAFDWRSNVPGILRVQWDPMYWVYNPNGFDHRSAPRRFAGFVQNFLSVEAGHNEAVADMRQVLELIEQQVPTLADGPGKDAMLGIYMLWDSKMVSELRRPDAKRFLAKHGGSLRGASMTAFITYLLAGQPPDWSVDQWSELATSRRADRERLRENEIPATLDAALNVLAAEASHDAGRLDEATRFAAWAVEELPGNTTLLDWEQKVAAGQPRHIDLTALVGGRTLDPGAPDEANATDEESSSASDASDRAIPAADA